MNEETKEIKRWKKMGISLKNYQSYIKRKTSKYDLDLVDLLYISNFKGGNASIHQDETDVLNLLKPYSKILHQIAEEFGNLSLAEISEDQTHILIDRIKQVCNLCLEKNTGIDGFKSSYFSAMFHAYFPELIPILDRRVLINLQLITEKNLKSSKQVIDIHCFYPLLIEKMQTLSKKTGKSLRALDGEFFGKPFPTWAKDLKR